MKYLVLCLFLIAQSTISGQIQLANDEFNHDSTMSAWSNITSTEGWCAEHLEVFDINSTSSGHLHMQPWTTSWYQDYRGPLLFKLIDGNFMLTTEVTATNHQEDDTPGVSFSLAGLMMRTPRNDIQNGLTDWAPGGENYIFLACGTANPVNAAPHLEVKNTFMSNSNLQITPISTNINVQIRLVRIDQHIICLYKIPGEDWQIRRRYNRSDFPDTLQIGFVTYTDWPKLNSFPETYANSHVINNTANPDSSNNPGLAYNPDLIANFEFARFDSVVVPPPLVGANLSNTSAVSDSALLLFLGQPSQPLIPDNQHYIVDTTGISILADQDHQFINILGDLSDYSFFVTDTSGSVLESYSGLYHKLTIDKADLPSIPIQIIIENNNNQAIRVQRFLQE